MGFFSHAVTATLLASALVYAQSPGASSSSKPHAKERDNGAPDAGVLVDGLYRNASLNFSYKVPFGWVDRTPDMREGSEVGKSLLLLSVFEHPPEAPVQGVNSSVLIAAESSSSYPGLKTPADYLGPLTELAAARGFKASSDPYEFQASGKQLVRGDFAKQAGTSTLHQTSLVYFQKNWIVSFTFIAGSDDEVDVLLENLNFAGPIVPHKPSK
jgi:hypothetical protein